jgi:hypothetical protein
MKRDGKESGNRDIDGGKLNTAIKVEMNIDQRREIFGYRCQGCRVSGIRS